MLRGTIHILQDDFSGKRTITAVLGPGDLFGEALAFSDIPTIPFDILSATKSEILFIDVEHSLLKCDMHCEFYERLIRNILKIIAQKNRLLNRKLYCVTRKTTREKLLSYLFEQSKQQHNNDFYIPLNRQELADYLGVERSAMSSEISKLQKLGIWKQSETIFIYYQHILQRNEIYTLAI